MRALSRHIALLLLLSLGTNPKPTTYECVKGRNRVKVLNFHINAINLAISILLLVFPCRQQKRIVRQERLRKRDDICCFCIVFQCIIIAITWKLCTRSPWRSTICRKLFSFPILRHYTSKEEDYV